MAISRPPVSKIFLKLWLFSRFVGLHIEERGEACEGLLIRNIFE